MEGAFFTLAGKELKRAERYRIFLSLICLDLSFVGSWKAADREQYLADLEKIAHTQVRECDTVHLVTDNCLALLYPETNRDGAEVAARRISDALRNSIENMTKQRIPDVIPLEIASFPDAAGTKTVLELLSVLSEHSRN